MAEKLDLRNAVHVGHSTGGGQVARYVAQHGQSQDRVAMTMLIASAPPLMVKTDANPDGVPIETFNDFRNQLAADRAQFYQDVPSGPFYGFNRLLTKSSEAMIENWWRQGMMGGANAHYHGIKAFFLETDQTADLQAITVPTLNIQGDDDQVVPYKNAGLKQHELIQGSILKIYPGAPHGMHTTHAEEVNADILNFIRG